MIASFCKGCPFTTNDGSTVAPTRFLPQIFAETAFPGSTTFGVMALIHGLVDTLSRWAHYTEVDTGTARTA